MPDFTARLILAAAAGLAAATNIAAPAAAAPASSVAARVAHADLNLASEAGVRRLEQRIARAAQRLCGEPGVQSLAAAARQRACIAEAVASAGPQLQRLTASVPSPAASALAPAR